MKTAAVVVEDGCSNEVRVSRILSGMAVVVWDRFERSGNRKDLDCTIALERLMLDFCPCDDPNRWKAMHDLAIARALRYKLWGGMADLDRAINLWWDAIALCPNDHPLRSAVLHSFTHALSLRFDRCGRIEDLENLVTLRRSALGLLPSGHKDRPKKMNDLACSLRTRFERGGNLADLEESVMLHRSALRSIPDGSSDRSKIMRDLADTLKTRFEKGGSMEDMEESIALYRVVVTLPLDEDSDRSRILNDLANLLRMHSERCGSADDLDESIVLHRIALSLRPEGHPLRSTPLNNLAAGLYARYEKTRSSDDLHEAIELFRAALALFPESHPSRASALNNLATALSSQFELHRNKADLDESISLRYAAMALCLDGDGAEFLPMNSLGRSLATRFKEDGKIEDLQESIAAFRSSVDLCPESHPERFGPLNGLADALLTRFEHTGSLEDLNASVALHRTSLALCPEKDPFRRGAIINLANSLKTRFDYQTGNIEDLNEAIALYRSALALNPEHNTYSFAAMNNLASTLMARYRVSGNTQDIDDAIALHRTVLSLDSQRSEGHPDYSRTLLNIAGCLSTRFEERGEEEDLKESISLHRTATALFNEKSPEYASVLNNFASSLSISFKHSRNVEELDEAIALHRTALALLPEGHHTRLASLNNLAGCLLNRFERNPDGPTDDLHESFELFFSALAICSETHPDHSLLLYDFSACYCVRFEKEGNGEDLEEAIRLLRRAVDHPLGRPSLRYKAAQRWITWARLHDHNTAFTAYKAAISVVQRTLTVKPTLAMQHDFLTKDNDRQRLGLDAAAYATKKGDLKQAIELLEHGRGLIWSQMRGFRTPLDRLAELNKPLAIKFRDVGKRLEALVMSSERLASSSGEVSATLTRDGIQSQQVIDEMLANVLRLTSEQEEIVNEIRKVPGFEDFLSSPSFEALQEAASEGPVIVVNHSQFRCDAIIVTSNKDVPCALVPLDEDWLMDAVKLCNDLLTARHDHKVHSQEYNDALRRAMKVLWERVVSKVVEKFEDLGIPKGSRIWWCPTFFLSLLPFHAAGPYGDGCGKPKYLLDDYISSYIPTLKSLIIARSGIRSQNQKLLFVGDTKLRATKKERDIIRRFKGIDKCLLDERATREAVMKALRKSAWVHFACHGQLRDFEPFESSIKLFDGGLTLLDIARARLPNAEFAFLSACHTAEQSPAFAMDEVLHLAAAMQFCGFRSVVGTMWQMLDHDGPFLAGCVYAHLMHGDDDECRFKRSAAAVREAALRLRDRQDDAEDGRFVDIVPERWVNLVHIGA